MGLVTKEQLATDLIEKRLIHHVDYLLFQRLYPFANENVSGYLNHLDLENKSLLTVGSSADQTISAITRGCKDITVLDLCPFTQDYFSLKKSAIETLSPKEFSNLFFYKSYPNTFSTNKKPFDLKKHPKLLAKLKKESQSSFDFWMTLVNTYSGEMIRKNFFTEDEEKPTVTRQLVDYLKSDEAYYKTRQKIKNIHPKFITANITHQLPLDRSFDNIILSNLTTYLNYEEIHQLFESLKPYLTPEGKMILGYLYRTYEDTPYCEGWDEIYNIPHIKSIDPNIILQTIQGVRGILHNSSSMKDAVYIYQKKR